MRYTTTHNVFNIKDLNNKIHANPTTPRQARLDLRIETAKEVNGIGMGVLSDGTAYLTARGLAKLCGLDHTTILDIGNSWSEYLQSPKVTKIKELLYQRNSPVNETAYFNIIEKNVHTHAYPDYVCIAILEYYAFEAGVHRREVALKNFRELAGAKLKDYIYENVGYDPSLSNKWKPLLDRLAMTSGSVPVGYFSIFKETIELAVALGEANLHVDQGFIHDISVGRAWSTFWKTNKFDEIYGYRIKYNHEYPESFAQFFSNPQEAYAYPDEALAEFRRWLREDYINGNKLRAYLTNKVKERKLPIDTVDNAILSYQARFLLPN